LNGDDNPISLIKSKLKGCPRLSFIEKQVMGCVSAYNPDLIIIEGYSFGSRLGQAFSIGELGGLVKVALFEGGYKSIIIPPTCLKKFVTGKGNASKDIMLMKTFKKYGVEFTDNNKCDAFGLAQMGKAYLEGTEIMYEQEALKKIKRLV
jgi:Holliday junction resolvasome RuvABC endonuclease subunit